MSSNTGLKNAPLRQEFEFNWIFLVELILCGVLTLFFVFYFNRVLGAILSYGIRSWTWHKYRVYVDVRSFQFSILAGRIFFKELRYHGNNETILIQSGYITWRYWLRNVRQIVINRGATPNARRNSKETEAENKGHDGQRESDMIEEESSKLLSKLPCRLIISLKGVEWFIYNRSQAYDSIASSLAQASSEISKESTNTEQESLNNNFNQNSHSVTQSKDSNNVKNLVSFDAEKPESPAERISVKSRENTTSSFKPESKHRNIVHKYQEVEQLPFILRFLPIQIECEKAAVVLGNHNTQSVLIVKIEKATGNIDASDSSSKLDLYRQLINVNFEYPTIQIKPNDDYKEEQTESGLRAMNGLCDPLEDEQKRQIFVIIRQQYGKVLRLMQDILSIFKSQVNSVSTNLDGIGESTENQPHSHGWKGLSRYLDDSRQDDNFIWSTSEYARVSTILESPSANMEFYWDSVGFVQEKKASEHEKSITENINGDIPPEWGINLSFRATIINYGPWADRQRVDIQRVFFPNLCEDAITAKKLTPGELRVPTKFKINIEFDEESILRIPTKEESKNWKWTKQAGVTGIKPKNRKKNSRYNRKSKTDADNHGPKARPFGWLDLKFSGGSTVNYNIDVVAGIEGFSGNLDITLPSVEITTSVNHGLLWKSCQNCISCDLSQPLKWNGPRAWRFDINSKNLEFFFLREHVFLLTDLIDDWTYGPPQEYLTFCPLQIFVSFYLEDFKVYFNVNDSNIINNPSDFDDNTFIVLSGSKISAKISIPLDDYRPHRNKIPFDIDIQRGSLSLLVPHWNTHATFLASKELSTAKKVTLKGNFQYCSTVSASNTDTLLIDVSFYSLSVITYGFAIRLLLKIKDNYLGEDIHFKTLEEYQAGLASNERCQKPEKISNDLDIIIAIYADECKFFLPSNLYAASESICIEVANISSDIRFNNYYMDYQLDLSAILFLQADQSFNSKNVTSNTQLSIDGLNLHENRLFGLPPSEPTYVCNRDISVGAIKGECTTEFLRRLLVGFRAFSFSFDDNENVLPSILEESLHEVIFFRATIDLIDVWLHVEDSAFTLSTKKISITSNNWAGPCYSKKLKLLIPELKLGCIDTGSASGHKSKLSNPAESNALLQSSISFVIIEKNPYFEKDRQLQQEHVQRHDQRTNRCSFLLRKEFLHRFKAVSVKPPTIKPPPMPAPIFDGGSVTNNTGSLLSKFIGNKNSFQSLSTFNTESIINQSLPNGRFWRNDIEQIQKKSQSTKTHFRNQYRPLPRELYSFSDHQSSIYSAIDEINVLSQGNDAFSDSHIEPHFPLDGIELNTGNLPEKVLEDKEQVLVFKNHSDINFFPGEISKEGKIHTSYVIVFTDPIKGFLNSKSISVIAKLLKALLPININDILDELQITSMNEIKNNPEEKLQLKTSFDLGLHVPSINLRFLNPMISQSTENECHDQFDLSISGLAITLRSETKDGEKSEKKISKSFLLHIAISSSILTAKINATEISDTPATISFTFGDFILWANFAEKQTMSARLKLFELLTYSCTARNAASMLRRTKALKVKYEHEFSTLSKEQEVRIRLLTYLVTTSGQQITEPLFLTRPSYVLRSAIGHIRTHISWTIISRLHHIYNSLDRTAQHHIASICHNNSETLPEDAKQRTLASLARWRSWDLSSMDNCTIISKIFGSNSKRSIDSSAENSFQASLEIEECRLVIDPGPKQNIISIFKASINLKKSVESPEFTIKNPIDNQRASVMVADILVDDISIICNWELHEMTRDILLMNNRISSSLDIPIIPKFEDNNENFSIKIGSDLHFIFAIHKASLHIDTINLRKTFVMNETKASFIKVKDTINNDQNTSSLIVIAKDATSNMKSHSQDLCLTQLQLPSICISYQKEIGKTNSSNVLNIAANCQELNFILRQDMLALVEIMNLLIIDEIAQVYELTRIIPRTTPSKIRLDPCMTDISSVPKVSIALFLDRYHLSIQLLHPLRYEVFGHVARASITAQLNKEIIFDFDIKDHAHDIKNSASQSDLSITSLLKMPPTNGRVTLHMFDEDNVLSVFASIEPVILDADIVHTLVTTTNRPEVLDMIEKVLNNFGSTKSQFQNILYRDQSVHDPQPSQDKALLYDARLTLAGFGIIANKSSAEKQQNAARLDFHLGCVQLVAMNRVNANRVVDKFPQLRITLTQVMFNLARWDVNEVSRSCGSLTFDAFLTVSSKSDENMQLIRSCHFRSNYLKINLFSDTVSTVLDVLSHLQNKMKDIDLPIDNNYLRKIRKSKSSPVAQNQKFEQDYPSIHENKSNIIYSFELFNIQVNWLVEKYSHHLPTGVESEDLVLSLRRMEFSTRKKNSAQLRIETLQLQMVPSSQNKTRRSLNSALLPEIIFNVGYVSMRDNLQLAFQAGGKSLDLRLTSRFMIPVSAIKESIVSSVEEFRKVSKNWSLLPETERKQQFLGKKHLESLSIDADFAGAVVYLCRKSSHDPHDHAWDRLDVSQERKSGKFSSDDAKSVDSTTVLRSPGIAFKIEYKDCGIDDLSLNAEVKVDASSNILYPSVVPIIMEISSTVKEIVSNDVKKETDVNLAFQESMDTRQLCPTDINQTNPGNSDQITVLERTKLNLGLRICRQEFGLSCQPIGRVAATAQFEDIYIVVNTVRSNENNQNFAASAIISELKASVQHVYSREATGIFEIEDVVISLMNSKHVGSTNGLAAILRTSPIKTSLNAKQLHDFLLFREIWMPPEIRRKTQTQPPPLSSVQPQTIFAQKYQQVASISSFPWNATLIITGLDAQLDLGQAIGKSALKISKIWLSYKKNSEWDQNLCLGIENIDVESTGRMSGLFALEDFKLRTSIKWIEHELMNDHTPLIQGSIIFKNLSTKAAFDYQAFLVANIKSLHFLMFNTFTENSGTDDRLTAILEAEAVQAFCTTASSSHALALYQAFQKLIQEKRANFETSLSEIENFLLRTFPTRVTSTISPTKLNSSALQEIRSADSPIYLKTDVIVMLKAVNVGTFPTTFLDHQVFKLEALDIEARFGVTMDNGKIHSILSLTLGQLRIGLAAVKNHETSKSLGDISVEKVVSNVTGSRGGTILKVPKVEAVMQTWQVPKSNQIEYIFKSLFGGKVEVGWNYSRISYIRSMWAAHTKALAQRLGKPLPLSAVRITGVPDFNQSEENDGKQRKITAEVNVPQSKYNYSPLEPPIIETPQLKDMGEATPPMEWIGLHRDRLPTLTHQIVIVSLLELVSQVEEAYTKILGNS
ncbi:putative fermentation associated protein [Erysiphe neolycopersici]|uniref:Putative fermentation associated protein n=1 Tax=Erysiphe neolycopersici TaxID=212602 RepID=A0A420HK69_9PEZI|nr:putative fermentation associated protein [Erysiphe neolycopersici]